jgi:hypothetical protein
MMNALSIVTVHDDRQVGAEQRVDSQPAKAADPEDLLGDTAPASAPPLVQPSADHPTTHCLHTTSGPRQDSSQRRTV